MLGGGLEHEVTGARLRFQQVGISEPPGGQNRSGASVFWQHASVEMMLDLDTTERRPREKLRLFLIQFLLQP